MDLYGDNLVHFTTDGDIDIKGDNVTNAEETYANGGKVLVKASLAEDVVDSTMNMQGIVRANSISSGNGKIVLHGSKSKFKVNASLLVTGEKNQQAVIFM